MTRCPLGSPDIAEIEFETAMRELPLRDMPLRSWIIAPREAVAITIES
jgi:hypothetical protein